MYHSYGQAVTAAVTMFGENWWRTCTIKQPTGVRLHASYYVAFITPKLGLTRPH